MKEQDSSIYTGAELTQVPIRNSIIIIQFIFLILLFLNTITLMLLGNCAGAVKTWSDVLLIVWNGLILFNVPLMANMNTRRSLHYTLNLTAMWVIRI